MRIIHGPIWLAPFPPLDKMKEAPLTDRTITDADRAPPRAAATVGEFLNNLANKPPADQAITDFLELLNRIGYSDFEIGTGLETAVYQRKQYGL